MMPSIFSRYSAGGVAGLSAIMAVSACGSEVDDAGATDMDETASSSTDDDSAPSTDDEGEQATPDGGADTTGAKADTAPAAEPPEEPAALCEESSCAATIVRPERTPDGEVSPIPCSLRVPSPLDGQSYGAVEVRIILGDGSEVGVPFVETEAKCDTAEIGWFYAEGSSGVEITLCPQTCEDAVLGLEARYHCQSLPATCPLLGPPPSL